MHRTSFLFPILVLSAASCGASHRVSPAVPVFPGEDACTTTIRSATGTATMRGFRDGNLLTTLVDSDGDQQPDEQRRLAFSDQGDLLTLDRLAADGSEPFSRETRSYQGRHLVRIETDRWHKDGTAGVDGVPDTVVKLIWEGDRLLREESDELAANGLPGVDGQAEFVTTWEYVGDVRTKGTRVDVRDETVLQIETLTWDAGNLIEHSVDLGGDGTADVTATYRWKEGKVRALNIDGALDPSEIEYEYCR